MKMVRLFILGGTRGLWSHPRCFSQGDFENRALFLKDIRGIRPPLTYTNLLRYGRHLGIRVFCLTNIFVFLPLYSGDIFL
jgi:hypothetical protein